MLLLPGAHLAGKLCEKRGAKKARRQEASSRRTFSNISGAVSCAAPRQTERLEQASFRVNETHFHIMKYLEWPYLRSVSLKTFFF